MQVVHVNYVVEQDEDGVWCAEAPALHANGYGDTRKAAIEDLRESAIAVIEALGAPEDMAVTVGAA